MDSIKSADLKRFLEQDKRKFEGVLPDVVKRLILNTSPNISYIRMPDHDDIWAPGFDGIVETQEQTTYVAEGKSIWEFGTNADSLNKINTDYEKRTNNPLGIDKSTTTFYIVIPRVWAYDNQGMSISKWESDHKNGWRDIHVYDASILCDWINSEPTVCAWLFEQFGEVNNLFFSTVTAKWASFSNYTNPPLTFSMFLEDRQDAVSAFQDRINLKKCRVRSDSFIDAYGFCLSALTQSPEMVNKVIVVDNENTYNELIRFHRGKIFLLSFPFSGQVSDDNSTIICYSKESPPASDMIDLPRRWKTQFTKALCDMGLSETNANECYSFTHGNLLSLIRRIPGNAADSRPKWANDPNVDLLYPIIFLRQFCTANDMEKRVIEAISGISYADVVYRYSSFLRMEDTPISKIDNRFFLVNYEEAWMTLNVNASDEMSSRMHKTVIALLKECRDTIILRSSTHASIITRLLFNYIYFAETDSDQCIISNWVKSILELAKYPGCKEVIFGALSYLAEAAPSETLKFIESELEHGVIFQAFSEDNSWSSNYLDVLWALDQLVLKESTALRACRVLYKLCKIQRKYQTSNSPKDSLLNSLCLWSNHTDLTIEEKTRYTIKLIEDDNSFGVPFAIELVSKTSTFTGNRIGVSTRSNSYTTYTDLYIAHKEITSAILNAAIKERRADWIENALKTYWRIPCEVLISSSELLASAGFSPEQKLPIIFQIKSHLYYIHRGERDGHNQWVEPFIRWLDSLITDDPISKEGWRFYKFHNPPFQELFSYPEESFFEIEQQARLIREKIFSSIRNEYGIEAIIRLVGCMENISEWGDFLAKNLLDKELLAVSASVFASEKKVLLASLINSINLKNATEIYYALSPEDQASLLPLLYRDDIDEWLTTPELERLYWRKKQLTRFSDYSFHSLLKYNPCGLLGLFIHKKNEPDSFNQLIVVVRAIVDSENYSNISLLTYIVREYDSLYYSDEWAELCLAMYDKSVFKGIYRYYPGCLKTYFFKHPEKMVERYYADSHTFYSHFHFDYSLPNEAYENQMDFTNWSDYLFDSVKEYPILISTMGAIFGKSGPGKDNIFPHEYVRIILEKYSDDELTRNVAIGWINSRGARFVQDGLNEKKMELQYRKYARSMEIEYPQTAKLLSIIADDYEQEAKNDRLASELFPL